MLDLEKRPIHILTRFSDNLFAVGDAISKHQEIIQQNGSVWFGKLGKPVSQKAIDVINLQVKKNIPSYIYLVKGTRKKSNFYKAKIIALSTEFPKKEKNGIPPYYFEKKIVKHIKFWAKITDIQALKSDEVKLLKVKSSVLDIEETLLRSSAGLFYVVIKNKGEIGL